MGKLDSLILKFWKFWNLDRFGFAQTISLEGYWNEFLLYLEESSWNGTSSLLEVLEERILIDR